MRRLLVRTDYDTTSGWLTSAETQESELVEPGDNGRTCCKIK